MLLCPRDIHMWWQSNIGGSYNGVGDDNGVAGDHGGGCKADRGGGKSKKDFLTELTPLDGENMKMMVVLVLRALTVG